MYAAALGFSSGFFIEWFGWSFFVWTVMSSFVAAPLGLITFAKLITMPIVFILFALSGHLINHYALYGHAIADKDSTFHHFTSTLFSLIIMMIGLFVAVSFGKEYDTLIVALSFLVCAILVACGARSESPSKVRVPPSKRAFVLFLCGVFLSLLDLFNLIEWRGNRELIDFYIYSVGGVIMLILSLVLWWRYSKHYGSKRSKE